jgi:hypothetical protein
VQTLLSAGLRFSPGGWVKAKLDPVSTEVLLYATVEGLVAETQASSACGTVASRLHVEMDVLRALDSCVQALRRERGTYDQDRLFGAVNLLTECATSPVAEEQLTNVLR